MDPAPLSLTDPAVQQCPYPFYRHLRQTAPVAYMPELQAYYVSRYDLCRKVLIDTKRFAKRSGQGDGRRYVEPSAAALEILERKDGGTPITVISFSEGADHRDYRNIVDRYFDAEALEKLKGAVQASVDELMDGFAGQPVVEVVDAFAIPLPLYVISDMLGIPKSEYRTFKRWSDGLAGFHAMKLSEAEAIAGAESICEMHAYMRDEVAKRRTAPREDLLTVLALATFQGRPLTEREIGGITDELLVAGNETTANTLSAGLLTLAQDQELQARLRADRALIEPFVEELLRITTPLQITLRMALTDVTLGGVDIPAGSTLFVGLASSNRDDEVFEAPDSIELARHSAKPLISFGAGGHFCLGAGLARLELQTAFAAWLDRYRLIELGQPADSVRYPRSYALRGPVSLTLKLSATS